MAAVTARASSAKDRALAYVKSAVLTGEFPGGELISEGDIAAALGMSRTPVREAFLRLEAEGLLRLYPQRGALVVPVSSDEVRAVMEARMVLEQFAAAKTIGRGGAVCAEVFLRLTDEVDRQRRAAETGDWRDFLESDGAFHNLTMTESGNPILSGFYASLRDRQMRMIGESALRDPQRVATILNEHRAIADALRDADAPRVAQAIGTHLASTMRAIRFASR